MRGCVVVPPGDLVVSRSHVKLGRCFGTVTAHISLWRFRGALVRVLVFGAGVIGSVYAGKLLHAGHDVVLLVRGPRLVDLQSHGLILADAESGKRTSQPVEVISEPAPDDHFDLVLVAVRAEQIEGVLPA
jgi:siroheme synthase (precorrin-2 oxidase/ferrochelatase)